MFGEALPKVSFLSLWDGGCVLNNRSPDAFIFRPPAKVAAYFTNLIILKFTTGLMIELCFGGRPLKFFRLLAAEIFTDPSLRAKVTPYPLCNVRLTPKQQHLRVCCRQEQEQQLYCYCLLVVCRELRNYTRIPDLHEA